MFVSLGATRKMGLKGTKKLRLKFGELTNKYFRSKQFILNKCKFSGISELVVVANDTSNPKENQISCILSKK